MDAQGQKGIVGQLACLGTVGSVGTRETSGPQDPKETRVILWWWRGRQEHGAARGSKACSERRAQGVNKERRVPWASLGHVAPVGRRERLEHRESLESRASLAVMASLGPGETRGTWDPWACVASRVSGA